MAYADEYQGPADEALYREVQARIGDERPQGLLAHLVLGVEGGVRHIGVWASEQHWQQFQARRVQPAVHAVLRDRGMVAMPPPPPVRELQLIDVQLSGVGGVGDADGAVHVRALDGAEGGR